MSGPSEGPRRGGRRTRRSTRPLVARAPLIALVLVGGGAGAACREALGGWLPVAEGVPVVVPLVNVVGAFLLGVLYEGLARTEQDSTRTARVAALLGTGFCGGLTTYSALATDTAVLLYGGHPALAAGYALGTVVVGAAATVIGIASASRIRPSAATSGAER